MKNPTYWTPNRLNGYVVSQLGIYLQDNLGNTIVTNSLDNIIPNAYYVIGKYATLWSQV